MRRLLVTIALAGALSGAPGAAQDATLLGTFGLWHVEHTAGTDGSAACSLSSYGADGSRVGVWAFDYAPGLTLEVSNPAWAAPARDVQISVDIGPERFSGPARVSGDILVVPDLTKDFVLAFAAGRDLTLRNADGEQILRYSLRGSAAGVGALLECWARISPPAPDPFGASDPF